jgi:hypothetical protein
MFLGADFVSAKLEAVINVSLFLYYYDTAVQDVFPLCHSFIVTCEYTYFLSVPLVIFLFENTKLYVQAICQFLTPIEFFYKLLRKITNQF